MTTTQHKNFDLVELYKTGTKVQFRKVESKDDWLDCYHEPEMLPHHEYRVKPGTLRISVDKAPKKSNTAADFLARAKSIMEERGKQYDKPGGERSMGKTVAAFNAITGHQLTEAEGWLLLETLKNVRQWQNPGFHQDSADDGVAYSALKSEAKAKEASHVQA